MTTEQLQDSKQLQKTVSIRLIGPTEAKAMLAKNAKNNRRLRIADVKKYAEDMKTKKWNDDVSAIVFDADGRLTNGQHRLNAILLSGTEQSFIVAENWPTEAMLTMDLGNKRSFHDRVTVFGVELEKNVCTLVMHSMSSWSASQAGGTTLNRRGQEPRVIEVYKKHREFADFIGNRYRTSGTVSTLTLGAALHAYAQASEWYKTGKLSEDPFERVIRFLDIVDRGPVMESYNPATDAGAVALREWIQAEKHKSRRAVSGAYHKIMISALSRFLKGKPTRDASRMLETCPFDPITTLPKTEF